MLSALLAGIALGSLLTLYVPRLFRRTKKARKKSKHDSIWEKGKIDLKSLGMRVLPILEKEFLISICDRNGVVIISNDDEKNGKNLFNENVEQIVSGVSSQDFWRGILRFNELYISCFIMAENDGYILFGKDVTAREERYKQLKQEYMVRKDMEQLSCIAIW